MIEILEATAEDYMATLAAMVLIRSGCDTFPVDTVNLLRHAARIKKEGNGTAIAKDENGYTITVPEKMRLGNALCSELLLGILMDSMGYSFHDEREKRRFTSVFTCHLLSPRPVFRMADRTWSSIAFLEESLGLPRRMASELARCPSCYVPKEMNVRLLSQFRQHCHSLGAQDRTNEIALRMYLTGYEDDDYQLEGRPEIKTQRMQAAVDSLIPEHVLTKGHPASLYIEYTEDFETFSSQFGALDLEILYRLVFAEDPPLPLFGGRPEAGAKDYAVRMERYLSRESAARLSMANLIYQRRYHPQEADILTASIRKLYETT